MREYAHSSGELEELTDADANPHSGSIGIFVTSDEIYVTVLDVDVPDGIVQVSYDWFVKPLIRDEAHKRSFYVFSIGSDRCVLSQGDQNRLFAPIVPFSGEEFYAEDRKVQYSLSGGEKAALDYYSLDGHYSPYAGYRSRNDVKKGDFAKFVRVVTKQLDDYIRDKARPVVICCAREHESVVREAVSKMGRRDLVCDGYVLADSRGLSSEELHERSCGIVTDMLHAADHEMLGDFSSFVHRGLATDDLDEIGRGIMEGRVKTVFVSRGRGETGEYDAHSGKVTLAQEDAETRNDDGEGVPRGAGNDISNELVLAAMRQGAEVKVLAQDDMPTEANVTAVMRWAA